MRRNVHAGMTLIEVLIAVSLLSVLSLGMLFAMRVGMNALDKANRKLLDNRRVAGAGRIIVQQLAGFMPVIAVAATAPDAPGFKVPFFEGRARSMRLVSTYSLQQAARGIPQVLEFQVIPGEQGRGVRLVVNENPYTGPRSAGVFCLGPGPDPEAGMTTQRFTPIVVGSGSFVLADRLASCQFLYLEPGPAPGLEKWTPNWVLPRWPIAIRIEMASLDDDRSKLKPLTVTSALRVNRYPIFDYGDFE
ncbi:MAG: hypothetical protein DMG57_01955 [Acidobacteria bacterium]|nr:MAG: hypothetical protein DMG57_01955 [Acidobacteriota bacterium]